MIFFKLTLGYLLDMAFGDPYWLYQSGTFDRKAD